MSKNIIGSGDRSTPVGALIGNTEHLYDLARDKCPSARVELSKTIGTILETKVTERESELVADVLIELMRQAERDLRHAVAEQIAILEDVPLRLVLQLANDEIEIASPVLEKSTVLSDFDLMYIIKSKTSEYWQAIAKRKEMSDQVINVLADTNDFETALTLAKNDGIKLTDHAVVVISDLAQESESLAIPLLRRDEVEQEIAARLYKYVGEEVKNFIRSNFDVDAEQTDFVVDLVVQESTAPKDFVPDEYMISAAEKFKEKEMLNIRLMLTALRRGHMRSFVAQFSVFTSLSIETVGRMLAQADGRGLAVVSKAYGIEKQDFVSLFMLTNRIWNHGRMVETGDIQTAISHYNTITPEEAKTIIESKEELEKK